MRRMMLLVMTLLIHHQGYSQQNAVPLPPGGSLRVESSGPNRIVPEKNEVSVPKDSPSSIAYGATRESKKFLPTPQGNHAIDVGCEWKGKVAYLSLTYQLIVVDAKTEAHQWSNWVGAFWNKLTIVNTAAAGQPETWAVELSSSKYPEYKQRFDLDTGKAHVLMGGPAVPAGKPITPRLAWRGSAGMVDDKEYRLVTSQAEWKELKTKLFPAETESLPKDTDIDFTKEVALVCYAGKTFNWNGISPELVVENDERLLIRLFRHTYQSMGQTPDTYPYGIIVLPKDQNKKYVLEYNRQNLIMGPPIWKEFMTLQVK
jgi:hypothetical protein